MNPCRDLVGDNGFIITKRLIYNIKIVIILQFVASFQENNIGRRWTDFKKFDVGNILKYVRAAYISCKTVRGK